MNAVSAAKSGAERADMQLHERSILVVEDETIIAFLIEDMLAELGFHDVLHVASVPEAMALSRARLPDVAVLDVNVGNTPVYPVAERLAAAHIPFVFASGYGNAGIPAQWKSVPTIQKPFERVTLAAAIGSILG
jgi:CheY-like chemotaxis protein